VLVALIVAVYRHQVEGCDEAGPELLARNYRSLPGFRLAKATAPPASGPSHRRSTIARGAAEETAG